MRKINFNKKSFSALMIVFAMITGIVIQSCQVENDPIENGLYYNGQHYSKEELNKEAKKISEQDILTALNNKFGIVKVSDVTDKSEISKTLNVKNFDKITEYQFKDKGEHIYIVQDKKNTNSYKAFKTIEKNGTKSILGEKDLEYNKLVSNRYNKEYGHQKQEFSLASLFTLNTANAELCQRQAGETQSGCEDREYDEFVEDCFVCWVAYWTNPPVPLLISALCLCEE